VVAEVVVLGLLEVGLVPVVAEEAAAVMLRALKLLLKTEQVTRLVLVAAVGEMEVLELDVTPMALPVGEVLHQLHLVKQLMEEAAATVLLTLIQAALAVLVAHQVEILVEQEQEQTAELAAQILPTLEVLVPARHTMVAAVLLVLAVVL
jgi:hypothetical protein